MTGSQRCSSRTGPSGSVTRDPIELSAVRVIAAGERNLDGLRFLAPLSRSPRSMSQRKFEAERPAQCEQQTSDRKPPRSSWLFF